MADLVKDTVLREVTLPSGATAVFYKRRGKALVNAQRSAAGDSSRIAFALLANIIEVDGLPVLMEDLDEMDLFDVLKLQEIFGELGNVTAGPPATPLSS